MVAMMLPLRVFKKMPKFETRERILKIIDIAVEYSLYGMVFFIPMSNAAIEIFAGFAIFFFLIKKIIDPDFRFLQNKENVFLFIFLLFSIFSLFNSGVYFAKSMLALFSKWFEYVLIFIIIQDSLSKPKRMRNFMVIFMFMASIVAIDALSQQSFGVEFLRQKGRPISGVTASFGHHNNFGNYLVCVLPITLCLIVASVRKTWKLFFSCLALLLILLLLLTFSRTSWLSFVVAVICLFFLSRRFKIAIPFISIFVIILVIYTPFRERVLFTFQPGIGDSNRFHIWRESLKILKVNPFFGRGVNTFMDLFGQSATTTDASYAHNCYLQICVETGIFSLVSFLGFLAVILLNSIRRFRETNDYLLLGFIGAIIAFLVSISLDTGLYSLQLAVLFWSLLGMTENLVKSNSREYFKS